MDDFKPLSVLSLLPDVGRVFIELQNATYALLRCAYRLSAFGYLQILACGGADTKQLMRFCFAGANVPPPVAVSSLMAER